MKKYQSISTPTVQHSAEQAVVEVYMLNKHGSLPRFPWRKASGLAKEWGSALSLVRRLVKTRDVSITEILDLVLRQGLTLAWNKAGLIYWHIDNSYFEDLDLDHKLLELQELHADAEVKPRKKVNINKLLRKKDDGEEED